MQTKAIVAALLVLAASAGCARSGKEIFVREGCASCHRFRDVGGGGAPDLTDVAARRSPAWIRRQITDPKSNNSVSRMPAYAQLSDHDINALLRYLR